MKEIKSFIKFWFKTSPFWAAFTILSATGTIVAFVMFWSAIQNFGR